MEIFSWFALFLRFQGNLDADPTGELTDLLVIGWPINALSAR